MMEGKIGRIDAEGEGEEWKKRGERNGKLEIELI